MNKAEIKELLNAHNAGEYCGSYGPSVVGNIQILEVWVKADGEFHTRFIVSANDFKSLEFYHEFQEYCVFANAREKDWELKTKALADEIYGLKSTNLHRLITLIVASIVFMGSVGAFIYMFATGKLTSGVPVALLGGVIASGAVMFFGIWLGPKFGTTKAKSGTE